MSEKNNDIENFFKKRLNTDHFEYQEADWEALSKRLDEQDLAAPIFLFEQKFRLIIGVIVIIILSFLAGWWIRDQNASKQSINQKDIEKIVNNEASSTFEENLISELDCTVNEENENCNSEVSSIETCPEDSIEGINSSIVSEKSIYSINETLSHTKLSTKILSNKQSKTEEFPNKKRGSNTINASNSIDSDFALPTKNKSSVNTSSPDKTLAYNEAKPKENQSMAMTPSSIHTLYPAAYDIWLTPMNGNILMTTIADTSSTQDGVDSTKQTDKDGRLSVGLALSPDLNGVGLGNKMSPSLRPGIMIYYRFLPRFTLSSGVHYDQKKYETSAEEYSPPNGFWGNNTNGIIPSLIDGSCRVIDIPINLRMEFIEKPKVSFGGSLGVSSYILLDEKYDFEFANTNLGASNQWSTQENSNYFLGVANVSVYAAILINKKIDLIIEPYFKSPIKDIGWAQVALYSSGVQFVLKYNFESLQKQKK